MLSLISPDEIKKKREEIINALEGCEIPADLYKRVIAKRKFKNDYDFVQELANELQPWDTTNFEALTIEEMKSFKQIFFFRQGTLIRQRAELLQFLRDFPEFRSNDPAETHQKMMDHFRQINEWRCVNHLCPFKYLNQAVEYGGPTKEHEPFPMPTILPMRQELHAIPSQEEGLQMPPPE
jgi:hypothetical protein